MSQFFKEHSPFRNPHSAIPIPKGEAVINTSWLTHGPTERRSPRVGEDFREREDWQVAQSHSVRYCNKLLQVRILLLLFIVLVAWGGRRCMSGDRGAGGIWCDNMASGDGRDNGARGLCGGDGGG